VGECFFWYRTTGAVPDQRPLNSCVCVCVCVYVLETDRNSVSVTVLKVFRPKLDHVETETSRNWTSSVSCSELQADDVIFQKQWAGLTAWSESSQVHSASPPQLENRKYFL